jgi:hypothetical protein
MQYVTTMSVAVVMLLASELLKEEEGCLAKRRLLTARIDGIVDSTESRLKRAYNGMMWVLSDQRFL